MIAGSMIVENKVTIPSPFMLFADPINGRIVQRSDKTVAIRYTMRTGLDINLPPPTSHIPMIAFDPSHVQKSNLSSYCSYCCPNRDVSQTKRKNRLRQTMVIIRPITPTRAEGASPGFGSRGSLLKTKSFQRQTIGALSFLAIRNDFALIPPPSSESLLRSCRPGPRDSHPKSRRRSIGVGLCCAPLPRLRRGRGRRAR